MNNREQAKKLLIYYFHLLARKAGANWDSDNDAEVGTIIDCIFDEIEASILDHNKAQIHIRHGG